MMLGTVMVAAAGTNVLTQALDLFSQFATVGVALWGIWGIIVLASGLKDQNGPQIQSGVWQLVGGGLIVAAALLFHSVTL